MVSAQRCAPFASRSDQASGGTPTRARYRLCSARMMDLLIVTGAALHGNHTATAARAAAAKLLLNMPQHPWYARCLLIPHALPESIRGPVGHRGAPSAKARCMPLSTSRGSPVTCETPLVDSGLRSEE